MFDKFDILFELNNLIWIQLLILIIDRGTIDTNTLETFGFGT